MSHDPTRFAEYTRRVTEATQEAHEETVADVRAFGTRGPTSRRYDAINHTLAAEHTAALESLLNGPASGT